MMKEEQPLFVDVRSEEEFSNKAKDNWRNVGRIRNAVHLPFSADQVHTGALPPDKSKTLVLYAFSGQNEVFETASKLSDAGYKNVYVLAGGLFNLRWRAANQSEAWLKDLVTDIPDENR
jgi:rhodanese-related sulfurtransferase